jgi:hypothetical protein
MSELEVPRNSVFHPDNIDKVTLIILLQIKDYLEIIAAGIDEKSTDVVEELHTRGQFLCPAPIMPEYNTDWVETEEIKKDFSR